MGLIGQKAQHLADRHPLPSASAVVARVAGETSIDYTRADGTKGANIRRLLDLDPNHYNKVLYVGDSLYKGGNDESVIGCHPLIMTKRVVNPQETLGWIKSIMHNRQ